MTAELLTELVKNPQKIAHQNLHELKSLALQYPYCALFNILVAVRHKMEYGQADGVTLAKAAAFAPDRLQLIHWIEKLEKPLPAMEEKQFDFNDMLPEVSAELTETSYEPLTSTQETNNAPEVKTNGRLPAEPQEKMEISVTAKIDEQQDKKSLEAEYSEALTEPWENEVETESEIAGEDNIDEVIPEKIAQQFLEPEPTETLQNEPEISPDQEISSEKEAEPAAPLEPAEKAKLPQLSVAELEPDAQQKKCYQKEAKESLPPAKSTNNAPLSFIEWLKNTKPPHLLETIPFEPGPKSDKLKKHKKGIEGIPGSYEPEPIRTETVEKHKDIISETLAQILVIQGRYEEALEMYKLLLVKIPKKSAYFALQIRELEKKSNSGT